MQNHVSIANRMYEVIRALILAFAVVLAVLPFAYLFLNSVKLPRDFQSTPPVIIPHDMTLEHYQGIFFDIYSPTFSYFMNSVIITVSTTAITVFIGTLAAYSLSKLRVSLYITGAIAFIFLLVRIYPKVTTVLPYYILMRQLRLLDTLSVIIIAHIGLALPLVVWLMSSFIGDLPQELEESAMIDGCGPWQRFLKIVLPLTTPGLITAAVLTALLSWNEFLYAASLSSLRARTLPIAITSFITDKGMDWGALSAMATVVVVPMLVFALFAQSYLVRGLTLGAVKS